MPFFQRLKRAFGFDSQEYYHDEDEQGIDATVVPLRRRTEQNPQHDKIESPSSSQGHGQPAPDHAAQQNTVAGQDALTASDRIVPVEIFKTVVDVFNKSLPDFLGESVDAERQQKFLYDALDQGMKDYLDSLDHNARRRYDEMRHADLLKTDSELRELRETLKRQEEDSDELKKSQLSAERQKRALNERVRDLEKQIATLQADSEQLDLENKSLVNKLRINSLQEKDIEALRSDAAQLQEQLSRLTAENTRLKEGLEQAKLRDTLGETMVSDLQSKAAEALKSLTEKEKELADMAADKANLESELAEMQTLRDDLKGALLRAATAEKTAADNSASTDELHRQLEEAKAERDESRAIAEANATQLAKAREKLAVIAEIQTQVEQLEEARLKTDAQIRRHKDELLEKDELIKQKDSDISDKNIALFQKDAAIKRLEDMCDSLRKQIEDADFKHSEVQSALRSEINRLKRIPATPAVEAETIVSEAPTPASQVTTETQKTATRTVSIDYTLDQLPIIEKEEHPAANTKATTQEPRRQPRKTAAKPVAQTKAPTNEIPPIDEDNWLIPTPPRNNRQKNTETAENDDFGYKEPPRRPESDNPAQMSLF